jgi:hypothetical protein
LRQSEVPRMMESRSIGAAGLGRPPAPLHARILWMAADLASWAATIIFVFIGWLLFFYPVEKAMTMAKHLFVE